jgi:hypothetical protein
VNITFGMVIFRLNKVVLSDGVASILSKLPQALDLKNVAGVSTNKTVRANFSLRYRRARCGSMTTNTTPAVMYEAHTLPNLAQRPVQPG